jgi:large subunit ribosomal protein L29
MKPRNAKSLRELTEAELVRLLEESQETLAKQRFQHSLKQLQDTAYLKILKKDIARMRTLINERRSSQI